MTRIGVKEMVVRLPIDLHEKAKARAEVEDRSMSQLVRVALRHYLATTKPTEP